MMTETTTADLYVARRVGGPMNHAIERLYTELKERELAGSVVSIHRLDDLKLGIEDRHARGAFDEDFCGKRLQAFDFNRPKNFKAASIIVGAMPRPRTRRALLFGGGVRRVIIRRRGAERMNNKRGLIR